MGGSNTTTRAWAGIGYDYDPGEPAAAGICERAGSWSHTHTFWYEYDAASPSTPSESADSKLPSLSMAEDACPGHYYYGFRFYSATLSRWISRDPIEDVAFFLMRDVALDAGQKGVPFDEDRFYDEEGRKSALSKSAIVVPYVFCGNSAISGWDYIGLMKDESSQDVKKMGRFVGLPAYKDKCEILLLAGHQSTLINFFPQETGKPGPCRRFGPSSCFTRNYLPKLDEVERIPGWEWFKEALSEGSSGDGKNVRGFSTAYFTTLQTAVLNEVNGLCGDKKRCCCEYVTVTVGCEKGSRGDSNDNGYRGGPAAAWDRESRKANAMKCGTSISYSCATQLTTLR